MSPFDRVDRIVVHTNPSANEEREVKLVFLKQTAAHVREQRQHEFPVDICHSYLDIG